MRMRHQLQLEKGAYSNININYSEQDKTLTIGKREGSFGGMLAKRTFRVVFIAKDKAKALDPVLQADATVVYKGEAVMVKNEVVFWPGCSLTMKLLLRFYPERNDSGSHRPVTLRLFILFFSTFVLTQSGAKSSKETMYSPFCFSP